MSWLFDQFGCSDLSIFQFRFQICLPESKHLPNRWCCMMGRAVLCSGNIRPKNSRPKSNRRFLLFHVWAPFSAILLARYQVPKDLKKISDWILTPENLSGGCHKIFFLKKTFNNDQNLALPMIRVYPKKCFSTFFWPH